MIRTRTTFILGAGASADAYRLPTAVALNARIGEVVKNNQECIVETLTRVGKLSMKSVEQGFISQFINDLSNASLPSIDEFLSKRQEYVELGKLAICMCIAKAEFASIEERNSSYTVLWQKMVDDVNKPEDFVRLNQAVSFVTFNYDRSLEHYFATKLMATYNISLEVAVGLVKNLKIIHVYGVAGKLETTDYQWYAESAHPGQTHYLINRAWETAQSIKIMPEHSDDSKEFLVAKDWLAEAEQICFLGFGYHPENMRRLNTRRVARRIIFPYYTQEKPLKIPERTITSEWNLSFACQTQCEFYSIGHGGHTLSTFLEQADFLL